MPGLPVLSLALILTLSIAPSRAAADTGTLVGRASVIDGDTLEIRGERIRLHGIDAPESGQLCTDADGRRYRCGQWSAFGLANAIGTATVTCTGRSIDRYGRLIAVCRANGVDLNALQVRTGRALAYRRYSRDYAAAEDRARAGRVGMWQGDFEAPWDYRRR